jgi:hypothetical protein
LAGWLCFSPNLGLPIPAGALHAAELAIVHNQVTLPLQLLASRLAEVTLLAGGASQ